MTPSWFRSNRLNLRPVQASISARVAKPSLSVSTTWKKPALPTVSQPSPPPPPPPGPWGWGWDDDPFWDYPLATAATVGVVAGPTAAITSAALGSTVTALPANCVTVFNGNLTYFQCGSVWCQPGYAGSGMTYVVVTPP